MCAYFHDCVLQAEEQRLRDRLEAQLRQQQQGHKAQAEAYERDIIELKLKVEHLEEQGPRVRGSGVDHLRGEGCTATATSGAASHAMGQVGGGRRVRASLREEHIVLKPVACGAI